MRRNLSEWTVEQWLVAIDPREAVDQSEIRRHWRADESPVLDAVVARSPSLRLGTTEVPLPENTDLRGPVGRITDLIYLRGTTPTWSLPEVEEELAEQLLACLTPQLNDPPFEVVSPADLSGFLERHLGSRLTYRERLISER